MTTQVVPALESGRVTGGLDRLAGLDLVRLLAVVLVIYTQLATVFRAEDEPLGASSIVDDFLVTPLRANPDLEFFGAALIFLVTGFLAVRAAARQPLGEFAARRALRVFPPLWVAVLLCWGLVALGQPVPGADSATPGDLLKGLGLANHFVEPSVTLVASAWALLPIVTVYVLVTALIPILRTAPWLVVAIQITVCSVLLSIMPNFGSAAAMAGGTIGAYGTAVVLGEVVWLVWSGHVPLWAGGGLGLACWVVFAWADRLGYHGSGPAYPLTLAYAFLLVLAAVLISDWARAPRVVSYVASRSYGILLTHQAVIAVVLAPLVGHVFSAIAVLAAVAATLVAGELVHQVAERPAAWVATRLRGGAT
jgi:exopolysaccharide production protein ExoZ